MARQIYFDTNEFRRGNFFEMTSDELTSVERTKYELEDWIGRGGNAAVFRCRDRITGEEFAAKFLMRRGLRNTKRFLREVRLLQLVEGDHIATYHGTGRARLKHNKGTQVRNVPFVIMELAERNLQQLMMSTSGPLNYEQYAGQFRGLARALASLHVHAVHRDIKPENILIVGDRWLLSDYGLCTFVDRKGEDLTAKGKNIGGPRYWLSPEAHTRRLGGTDEINEASDVFQLAAIFWYVATGRHPSGILTRSDWTTVQTQPLRNCSPVAQYPNKTTFSGGGTSKGSSYISVSGMVKSEMPRAMGCDGATTFRCSGPAPCLQPPRFPVHSRMLLNILDQWAECSPMNPSRPARTRATTSATRSKRTSLCFLCPHQIRTSVASRTDEASPWSGSRMEAVRTVTSGTERRCRAMAPLIPSG